MRIGKIAVAIIGLVPFNVYGECTPTPDCASIGYTETSCEGDYLACPFDSTKLKCIPCDSSYRYNCSGKNITGGTGSACGGKYVSCECSSIDYVFNNGECICDASCKVGHIVYSDRTCSACIENGKTAVAVVVYNDGNKRIIKELGAYGEMSWSEDGVDLEELNNFSTFEEAKTDMNGKENTRIIVAYYGSDVDGTKNAAVYCYNRDIEGFENYKNQWYLPSVGEMVSYVNANKGVILSYISELGYNLRAWCATSTENGTKYWSYLGDWGWSNETNKSSVTYFTYASCFLEWN